MSAGTDQGQLTQGRNVKCLSARGASRNICSFVASLLISKLKSNNTLLSCKIAQQPGKPTLCLCQVDCYSTQLPISENRNQKFEHIGFCVGLSKVSKKWRSEDKGRKTPFCFDVETLPSPGRVVKEGALLDWHGSHCSSNCVDCLTLPFHTTISS